MIYIDKTGHMVADSLGELHNFAITMGLKRHYYRGIRKGHPHYDLTTERKMDQAIEMGAILVSPKQIIEISKGISIPR